MWDFFKTPLQAAATFILVAVLTLAAKAMKKAWEADKTKVLRRSVITSYWLADATSALGIVAGGIAFHRTSALQWFLMLYNVLLRMYNLAQLEQVFREKFYMRQLEAVIKAVAEAPADQQFSTSVRENIQTIHRVMTSNFPVRYRNYAIVSTLVWLWLAFYFVLRP